MCGEEAAEVADDCFKEVGVGGWLGTGVVEFEVREVQELRGEMKKERGRKMGKGRKRRGKERKWKGHTDGIEKVRFPTNPRASSKSSWSPIMYIVSRESRSVTPHPLNLFLLH